MSIGLQDIELAPSYDYESFSVPDGSVDFPVWPDAAGITLAYSATVTTNKDISVKFNSIDNVARPLTAALAQMAYSNLSITAIYVTNNSGDAATVQIDLTGK